MQEIKDGKWEWLDGAIVFRIGGMIYEVIYDRQKWGSESVNRYETEHDGNWFKTLTDAKNHLLQTYVIPALSEPDID
jgi:hypothetical protein